MDPGYLALQLFNGLANGSFYALVSLGLAVIFGIMRVVNFAHGAFYMLGAFAAAVTLLAALDVALGQRPLIVLVRRPHLPLKGDLVIESRIWACE